MSTAVSVSEAAMLMGISERHARRHARANRIKPGDPIPLPLLPADAQTKWLARNRGGQPLGPQLVHVPQFQLALPVSMASGTEAAHEEAARRYGIIQPLVEREMHAGVWRHAGDIASRVVALLSKQHNTPERTIWRWYQRHKDGGLPALARPIRSDKGERRALNEHALVFLTAALADRRGENGKRGAERPTAAEIYRTYKDERRYRAGHPERGPELPAVSYDTVLNWWTETVPDAAKTLAFEGPKAFRVRHSIVTYRDISKVPVLGQIVMDHRVLDLHCLTRDEGETGWRLVRPWVTAAIDMRTRRWLAWVMCETPSSDSIAACLKRSILRHGLAVDRDGHVTTFCYWDNGRDFCSEWLEGGNSVRSQAKRLGDLDRRTSGVLDTLGIGITHSIPENSRAKLIEPNFGRLANVDKTTPWYCGNKPGARTERFDAMVAKHEKWMEGKCAERVFPTIAEVAAHYDLAFSALNATELRGQGMRHITPAGRGWASPDQKWMELAPTTSIRRADPAALQFAFLRRREVTVKHSTIDCTINGDLHHYRLDDPGALLAIDGRKVEIGYDNLMPESVAVWYDGHFAGIGHDIELSLQAKGEGGTDEAQRRSQLRTSREFLKALDILPAFPDSAARLRRRAEVSPIVAETIHDRPLLEMRAGIQEAAAASRVVPSKFSDAEALPATESLPDAEAAKPAFSFFKNRGE